MIADLSSCRNLFFNLSAYDNTRVMQPVAETMSRMASLSQPIFLRCGDGPGIEISDFFFGSFKNILKLWPAYAATPLTTLLLQLLKLKLHTFEYSTKRCEVVSRIARASWWPIITSHLELPHEPSLCQ